MLYWLVRSAYERRGALAAVALHIAFLGLIARIDAPRPAAEPGSVLVSIVEAPDPVSSDPSDGSAPDFSPAPPEDRSADTPTETPPAPTELEMIENAARISDPKAPDLPPEGQDAAFADLSGAPRRPGEAEDRAEPRPSFRSHPLFDASPGPVQRFSRALQCARLTPSQRANCPTGALSDYAVASIAEDARAAAAIYDPVTDIRIAHSVLSRFRDFQADPSADSPYRLPGAGEGFGGRHMHTVAPGTAANQAAADTAGRVVASPDPVWGD